MCDLAIYKQLEYMMSCLDIEYFELVSTSCVLFNDYLNAYAAVNVIPQYPLYGDSGGFDKYDNHYRDNLFGANPY